MRHITYIIAVIRSCETFEQFQTAKEWAYRIIKLHTPNLREQEARLRFIDGHLRLQQNMSRIRDVISQLE